MHRPHRRRPAADEPADTGEPESRGHGEEGDRDRRHRHRHRGHVKFTEPGTPATDPEAEARAKAERRARRHRRKQLARWVADRWLFVARHRLKRARARSHNRRRLMWKVFTAWHETVWDARHGWKKEITADVHYKVGVMRRMFHGWRRFVDMRHARQRQVARADEQRAKQATRQAWRQWVVYIQECREEKERAMDRIAGAVHFWAASLERRAMVAWRRYALHRRAAKKQAVRVPPAKRLTVQAIADGWCNRDLVWRVWLVWTRRMQERRARRLRVAGAETHSNTRVARRGWAAWMQFVDARVEERDRVAAFQERRGMIVAADVVRQWRLRLRLVQRVRQMLHTAHAHDSARLMRLALRRLQAAVARRRQKAALVARALAHRESVSLRLALAAWARRAREAAAKREAEATVRAARLYDATLMRSAVREWRRVAAQRMERRRLLAAGLARHGAVLLRASFHALASHAARRVAHRVLRGHADAFRRRELGARALHQWRAWAGLRASERAAAAVARRTELAAALEQWRGRTKAHDARRARALVAEAEGRRRFVLRYLRRWEAFATRKASREEDRRLARRHDYTRAVGACLRGWAEYAQAKSRQRVADVAATLRLARLVQRRVVRRWRARAWAAMSERGRLDYAALYWRTRLVMRVWAAWRAYVSVRRDQDLQRRRAVGYYRLVTLSRHFVTWQGRTVALQAARDAEDERVLAARAELMQRTCHRVFVAWLEHTRQQFLDRVYASRADMHHRSVLLLRTLLGWYKYSLYRKYKEALTGRSIAMSRQLCVRRAFVVWRSSYHVRLVEHHRTWIAVRHWARTRMRGALTAWMAYHEHWRSKRADVRTAMAVHQRFLMTEGLAGMVGGAAHMRSRRLEAAQKVAAADVRRVWGTVERIARQWRRFTLAARQRREAAVMAAKAPKVSLGRVAGLEVVGPPTVFQRYQTAIARPAPVPLLPAEPPTRRRVEVSDRYERYVPPPRLRPPPRRPALLDPTLSPVIDQYADDGEETDEEPPPPAAAALPQPPPPETDAEGEVMRMSAFLHEQEALTDAHLRRKEERDAIAKLIAVMDNGGDATELEDRLRQLDAYISEFDRGQVERVSMIREVAERIQSLKGQLSCR